MWYIIITDYCSALKTKDIILYEAIWINFKDIIPNEIIESQKEK